MGGEADRMLGRAAVARGWVGEEALAAAVAAQAAEETAGRRPRLLGAILVERGHLTEAQLTELLDAQERAAITEEDARFGAVLVRNSLATWEAVSRALAEQMLQRVPQRLGEILAERGEVAPQALVATVRAQERMEAKRPGPADPTVRLPAAALADPATAQASAGQPVSEVTAGQHPERQPRSEVTAGQHPERQPRSEVTAGRHPERQPRSEVTAGRHPERQPRSEATAGRHPERERGADGPPPAAPGEPSAARRPVADAPGAVRAGPGPLPPDAPTLRPMDVGPAPAAPPTTPPPPAPVFAGRYELLKELGRGGMGVVYRARDRRLGRDVALKVLLVGDRAEPDDVGRFKREVQMPAADAAGKSLRTLTRSHAMMGTPSYMSPEQTRDAGVVDGRADVYAAGASLYEKLTGRPPFHDAASLADLLVSINDRDPDPPRRTVPDLDLDLETICLKCLAKDPADRYPTAADLARRPRGPLGHRLPTRPPPGQPRRPRGRSPSPPAGGEGVPAAGEGDAAARYWVYLPAGPYRASGDRDAQQEPKRDAAILRVAGDGRAGLPVRQSAAAAVSAGSAPPSVLPTAGTYLARFEVTSAMYLLLLEDRAWHKSVDAAFKRAPRRAGTANADTVYWPLDSTGHFRMRGKLAWCRGDVPAFSISWDDATNYCKWLTARQGGGAWKFDLPTEDEWEKAARGPDGRFFPWGDGFDATFCRMSDSRTTEQETMLPEPIGLFPVDEGPFGVRDLAGGMREATATLSGPHGMWRIFKGGAWSAGASLCRGADCVSPVPNDVFVVLGLRLAERRTR